jgi:putative membrane protein
MYHSHYYEAHSLLFAGIHWLVSGLALLITSYVVPGFRVKDFGSALIAAAIIGLISALIRPLLIFLTLPIDIITLGLFTFVVDGIVLKMAAFFLRGFQLSGWFAAIFGAVILSLVGGFLHYLIY